MTALFLSPMLVGFHRQGVAAIPNRTAPLLAGRIAADGVTIPLRSGKLRIQQMGRGVLRVQFSKDGVFKPQRVPALVSEPATSAGLSFRQTKSSITVGGDGVRATIDRATETVRFETPDGKQFLAEQTGSRSLTPEVLADANHTSAYRARLGFLLSPGEGVYGLGQHQDGYMDYRGSPVVLEQVNREIAIPFLVSSNGYGLFWNNPAHTVVNVASQVSDLTPAQEFDEDGKVGGFTARYYTGEHFETLISSSREAKIDHDWDKTPPQGLPHDHYSARWTGSILAPKTGTYVFKTTSDDGVRLWLDDKLVIDNWNVHAPTLNIAKVPLKAGARHRFKLEFFQAGGGAIMRLSCGVAVPTNLLQWDSEAADGIDYCVFYGPSIDKVIAEYRQATGEAPMPPKTALGYWQSKERYKTQQEWSDIAAEYRRRRHPIDNLVQDWFYWDPWPWGSHHFDPKRYPDPAAGIAALHNDYHLQFMISVWGKFIPGSAEYPNQNLTAMNAKGFLYPGLDSSERYYDAFNPGARKLYWELMRDQIFKFGVDAWWLDASEPELNMTDFRRVSTADGPGALVLNAWPLMHTVGVSEGQLKAAPNKRVFILTRSAYAGQQRTGAACWSGDISATWQVYANQIPAGLNFCLSGIPYWTTDIGAFFVPGNLYPKHADDPGYRELFTRWFQYGAFCPIFRVHGTDFAKEMWRFGPQTEAVLNKYDDLRYRLMPYIYSQAWNVSAHGSTLMRALVMDFPQDRIAREVNDEFLFGPSLLICPVIQPGVRSRAVYLPSGTRWTDFWTGKSYAGGTAISADAPIDKLPIFVRAGAIVPMGPLMQYVGEKPTDPLEIRVYPGADGDFALYEDEGMNNDYKRGLHATIPITWNDRKRTLTVGNRVGAFPGMLTSRTLNFVVIQPGIGGGDPANGISVHYKGSKLVVR